MKEAVDCVVAVFLFCVVVYWASAFWKDVNSRSLPEQHLLPIEVVETE